MSSKSTTPNSTSTYEYSHEPFESFQSKVSLLVRSLFNCSPVEVRRIKGGSYNRTVVADLVFQGNKTTGIFRIPRFSSTIKDGLMQYPAVDQRILDHAAVLEFLSKRKVNSPHLLAFDSTAENCIGSPYTLQAFSTTIPLVSRYSNMTGFEKDSIVNSLVDFLVHMETIAFEHAGRLGVAPESASIFKQSLLPKADQTPMLIHNKGFEVGGRVLGENRSLYKLSSSLINARFKEEVSDGPNAVHECGTAALGSAQCPIALGSQPRNVLIRPNQFLLSENKLPEWTVIEWDDVYCVPPLLTQCPPVWLWDFSDDTQNPSLPEGYDGDADLLSVNRYTPDSGTIPKGESETMQNIKPSLVHHRLSSEDHGIKQYFEQKFVKELATIYPNMRQADYRDQAYGRGRWVHRVARFCYTRSQR